MKTNTQLRTLVQELKKLSIEKQAGIWKRVASELEKPSRNSRTVNIYKIDKNADGKETILVPGKVLGTGDLTKKVEVAAFNFSEGAYEKIKLQGTPLSIQELMRKNPEGKNVRIIG